MKKFFKQSVMAMFTMLLLVGCYSGHHVKTQTKELTLVDSAYDITDHLILNLKEKLTPGDSIIVATFADVNDLEVSCPFGRILADQVASRFTQRGYRIIELRFREGSVFMKDKEGEFILSRDLKNLSLKHNASAVVVGTYAEVDSGYYVSARIVNPSDAVVVSTYDRLVCGRKNGEFVWPKNN